MKKRILLSGLILSSGLMLTNGAYANTPSNEEERIPPGFSTLSSSDRETLETLTGSARDAFLTSKGIIRPETHSGSLGGKKGGRENFPNSLTLTDAEKTSLESMSETERQTFFTSKGITPPTASGKILLAGGKKNTDRNTYTDQDSFSNTNTTLSALSRGERIAQNKEKQLNAKKAKITKKIQAGESLTRLEKKFADAYSIEY